MSNNGEKVLGPKMKQQKMIRALKDGQLSTERGIKNRIGSN